MEKPEGAVGGTAGNTTAGLARRNCICMLSGTQMIHSKRLYESGTPPHTRQLPFLPGPSRPSQSPSLTRAHYSSGMAALVFDVIQSLHYAGHALHTLFAELNRLFHRLIPPSPPQARMSAQDQRPVRKCAIAQHMGVQRHIGGTP